MSYDSLVNGREYLSAHYLAEQLPKDIRKTLVPRWDEREKSGEKTPRLALRGLKGDYFRDRAFFADFAARAAAGELTGRDDPAQWRKSLHELHGSVLRALGFDAAPRELAVERADTEHLVAVAHAEPAGHPTVVAIECGWAADVDAALDQEQAGLLLDPVRLSAQEELRTGAKLASWLLAGDEPPRYVLILAGGVVILADRMTWGEGRYLGVSLDVALGRGDAKELETIAALFGADSLLPPEEGGAEPLAELVAGSRQHAVGVSKDLRDGLKESVEIIANEVLDRLREQGVRPELLMEPGRLAKRLGRESLRYLYRILFLLYAEARPELGVLPADDADYVTGYGLGRLGDLVVRDLMGEEARRGFHLHDSLDLLFRMVNQGHRPRGGAADAGGSDGEGLRFEPLKADLFEPSRTSLIGRHVLEDPRAVADDDQDRPGPYDCRCDREPSPVVHLDTRLRNGALYRVLRLLMLSRGKRKERGGFISYAQLGINQLGAVYEGLMSYTGFIADEELYEVAKGGDPSGGSWMIPVSKVDSYEDAVFVRDAEGERIRYKAGAFVYRLAGRDRQTSASYYTPLSLTQVTVQLALRHRLDQDGTTTTAREILDWTICEPALGSGAFLNEAVNQVAEAYLKRRQAELGVALEPESYAAELQKVKAYIALHNSYGVDLNETAVELAEVSLWLNVMHPGLQAPWFGLHLRRGNSLIGAGRRLYGPDLLKKKAWLTSAPDDHPFVKGDVPAGHVHHFLLPAQGWGAVAGEKEAKALAPDEAKRLDGWRKKLRTSPSTTGRRSQTKRLQELSGRVEYLWGLVQRRLEISEREIRREIKVWGADWIEHPEQAVPKEKVYGDLVAAGTPYWRLKKVMDAWCALWFWPLDKAGLLDGTDDLYRRLAGAESSLIEIPAPAPAEALPAEPEPLGLPMFAEQDSLFGESPKQLAFTGTLRPSRPKPPARSRVLDPIRPVIPLADLDDWLDFAEAVLGRADVPADSLVSDFGSLAQLEEYEDQLPLWMGMDSPTKLNDRFPCLDTIDEIATQQGFFHWELQFAQVFRRGGFDLQTGNPPWVQLQWLEAPVLAELEPWFELVGRPPAEEWAHRKTQVLEGAESRRFFIAEYVGNVGSAAFFGSAGTYELMAGSQPNLYRAFMIRAWANLGNRGIAGLIHPDSHFTGAREGSLRAATYRHLRLHAHFQNQRLLFADIDWSRQYGVQIYGSAQRIEFTHVSWLFDPAPLLESFDHDGTGERPGIKHQGHWDLRPHRDRLLTITDEVLAGWQLLMGETDVPVVETKLLYPVTTAEQGAITALSHVAHRLGDLDVRISSGYHEANAKKDGLIEWRTGHPMDWSEVILRGPQFTAATPFAKQPPNTGRNDRPLDLTRLGSDAVPSTDYQRVTDLHGYQQAQDRWLDHGRFADLLASPETVAEARRSIAVVQDASPEAIENEQVEALLRDKARRRYTEFYRLAWREMVPNNTERSVFAAVIPPGPSHIHAVRSMALETNRETVAVAGFWAALPIDYMLRVTGRGHLDVADARVIPAPDLNHPLAEELLLRTLRLNCLTAAYADLWAELHTEKWSSGEWAATWPGIQPLADIGPFWVADTPLRTEFTRRAALVELDALVALMLGIDADELNALYRSRFPQMVTYEDAMWFDANGRKIAQNFNAYGQGQMKEDFEQLMAHLADEAHQAPPEGYEPPFYKADRVREMTEAHAVFAERLSQAGE